MCLTVPVVLPDEAEDQHAMKQRARAKRMLKSPSTSPAVQAG